MSLSNELLQRLRNKKTRSQAMAEAAKAFGIKKQGRVLWWNATLDALDAYDPNWRGYAATPVQKAYLRETSEAA